MKKIPPFLFLLSAIVFLNACDDVAGRLKSRRGGFSASEKQNTQRESDFNQYLNVDSLDNIYKKDFSSFVALIKTGKVNKFYDRCTDEMKAKYSKSQINKYFEASAHLLGSLKKYEHASSSYDYDAAFNSINSTIEYNAVFEKSEGIILFAFTTEDDETLLTDFYFNLNEIEKIKPITETVKTLITQIEKKEYKTAYENASDNFKSLNFENYLETLATSYPNIKLDSLQFIDAIIKNQKKTGNVLLELGYSFPGYDGIVLNFNVLQNQRMELEKFEYVAP